MCFYVGANIHNKIANGEITLSFDIEAAGYGAVYATANVDNALKQFLMVCLQAHRGPHTLSQLFNVHM